MARDINPRLLEAEPIQRCNFPDCKAACCVYGTWVDEHEVEHILAHAHLIRPHLPPEHADPELWFGEEKESDAHALSGSVLHATVVDSPEHYGGTTCIFMRPDYKCGLQVAGEANHLHAWHFKPFFCILHPLDLDERGRLTLDETRFLINEPASCLRPANGDISLIEIFEAELRYLLGEGCYQKLQKSLVA